MSYNILNMVETELAMVRRHVRQGKERVAHQRRIVAKLEGLGGIADEAKALLFIFEELQEKHIGHLARLMGGSAKP